MNQADLAALLKRLAPTDWPRIWSAIYAHREACIAEVLDAPGFTRREIRERVRAKAQVVLETGPTGLRPSQRIRILVTLGLLGAIVLADVERLVPGSAPAWTAIGDREPASACVPSRHSHGVTPGVARAAG